VNIEFCLQGYSLLGTSLIEHWGYQNFDAVMAGWL
jgi:hypothetical protein